ncbi:hypothetical protein [Candidatus Chloroploca asiatica]|uniref:hypothetical protein n=1 Tax=Candidatus Chloroploca asiatica TaxID=1506545 RepID=UPI0015599A52|nr:hypothetical protein [Candidatus Chloroploca asiatica]
MVIVIQPIFERYERSGGSVAEAFFRDGLSLPSGSNLTEQDLERVVAVVRRAF